MSEPTSRDATHDENVSKLAALIEGIGIAMLTTVEDDGRLHSRPMATQHDKTDGDLWFFTKLHSGKVEEVKRDQRVNLSYSDAKKNRYISVTGTANVTLDKGKMKELWQPVYKAWFPDGLDDPEIALLRVSVESAEYWDAPHNTVVKLVGFVKAVVTGQEYQPGENKTLDLEHA